MGISVDFRVRFRAGDRRSNVSPPLDQGPTARPLGPALARNRPRTAFRPSPAWLLAARAGLRKTRGVFASNQGQKRTVVALHLAPASLTGGALSRPGLNAGVARGRFDAPIASARHARKRSLRPGLARLRALSEDRLREVAEGRGRRRRCGVTRNPFRRRLTVTGAQEGWAEAWTFGR